MDPTNEAFNWGKVLGRYGAFNMGQREYFINKKEKWNLHRGSHWLLTGQKRGILISIFKCLVHKFSIPFSILFKVLCPKIYLVNSSPINDTDTTIINIQLVKPTNHYGGRKKKKARKPAQHHPSNEKREANDLHNHIADSTKGHSYVSKASQLITVVNVIMGQKNTNQL